jgi:hypothetical protein
MSKGIYESYATERKKECKESTLVQMIVAEEYTGELLDDIDYNG